MSLLRQRRVKEKERMGGKSWLMFSTSKLDSFVLASLLCHGVKGTWAREDRIKERGWGCRSIIISWRSEGEITHPLSLTEKEWTLSFKISMCSLNLPISYRFFVYDRSKVNLLMTWLDVVDSKRDEVFVEWEWFSPFEQRSVVSRDSGVVLKVSPLPIGQ